MPISYVLLEEVKDRSDALQLVAASQEVCSDTPLE
jgi:hypothetical protein